jgi:hypothetical protein
MNQITKIAALGIALSSLASVAGAQPQISPQSIIVNPVDNALSVRVFTDRGGSNPVYRIGDSIRVGVTVNQDAYVYLFSVHSDGKVDLILPNKLSGGNAYLRANETRMFPPSGAAYQLNVDGPTGQDKVLAVASKRQLNINEIAQFQGGNQFADVQVTGQDNLARALSIVVQPVPASDWETAVAYFQVQGGYGTVRPPNGDAYIFKPLELIAYPGAVVQYQKGDDDNATVEFTTSTDLNTIAVYYRNEITSRGYTIYQYRPQRSRIVFAFRNESRRGNVEIRLNGPRYVLTINFNR